MPGIDKGQQQRLKETAEIHSNQAYMSINKPDHGAKKSGRNRDKSKSSDHYRQPYSSSSINDYDLVIDQEEVRPIADIDDAEESPQVMIISDNEQLRSTNYA